MIKIFFYFAVCMLFISISSAQQLTERYAHLGEMFVPQFSSAPFPHADRVNGRLYNNQTFSAKDHYSDSSVAIFIPKGFKPGKTIDLVVYFHGWNNNIDSACAQYKLIEQFSESKKNALFVFPEGPKDSPDSFGGRLEETDGLKKLGTDVLNYLIKERKIKSGKIGNIILAGHSGAYRVISFCLMCGGVTKNISDVILFDALYGQTEKFSYWIDHYKGRFVDIYTDSGGTKYESESLMADLKGWGVSYLTKEEKDISISDLKKNRLIFIHSDLTHNEVVVAKKQFRDYLSTSKLGNIK
jgi:hypothetical protein